MIRSNLKNLKKKSIRSEEDLVRMVVRIAQKAPADVIICATETGLFASQVHALSKQVRVIAATSSVETYNDLTEKGLETIRLPIRAIDRHNQVRHMLTVAIRSQRIRMEILFYVHWVATFIIKWKVTSLSYVMWKQV